MSKAWWRWCYLLPRVVPFGSVNGPTSRFTFYALLRNSRDAGSPRHQLREGLHGVRDPRLLELYSQTLEAGYQRFSDAGWPEPTKDLDGRIPVFVFAVDDPDMECGSPCMEDLEMLPGNLPPGTYAAPDRVVPVLALRSRFAVSTLDQEREQAQADAIHELRHLFNAKFMPYRRLPTPPWIPNRGRWLNSWLWLDEGHCVSTEAEFFPAILDWVGFALNWADRPTRSVDDPKAKYQAALFVRYVNRLMAQRNTLDFLRRVWARSQSVWNMAPGPTSPPPFCALTALSEEFAALNPPLVFCSADMADVFASGFCFDSYFLNDPALPAYEPQVFQRFTGRAVTRTWKALNLPGQQTESYPLPGLACRYFRFFPEERPRQLIVRVLPSGGSSLAAIKVDLALASQGTGNLIADSRQTAVRPPVQPPTELVVELDGFSSQTCDHAVLVVTNCGMTVDSTGVLPPTGYTGSSAFTINAELA